MSDCVPFGVSEYQRGPLLTVLDPGLVPVFLRQLLDLFRHPLQCATAILLSLNIGLKLLQLRTADRKSTRLNSSHVAISYAVFCLKKKNNAIATNKSARSDSTPSGCA